MSQVISNKTRTIPTIIHEDLKALFNFLYATPERSRLTVLASLLVFALYVIGTSVHDAMRAQGVCAF